MFPQLKHANSRRDFLAAACLAAIPAVPALAGAPLRADDPSRWNSAAPPTKGNLRSLPFNPEGPFDVRLRPVAGRVDYFRQTQFMQAFDRFGRPNFIRHSEAFVRREELQKEGAQELWHRVTWKFANEELQDGLGQRLTAQVYPYSKNFSHESPVTGGAWDLKIDVQSLPHTLDAFGFLQHPFDVQYIFYLVSEKWTGIEKLRQIGDTVTAGVEPKTLGDLWFTRPTFEFYFDPAVRYWSGEYRLTLGLAGLTKIENEWCARLDFDCVVPERMTIRTGSRPETRHIHAYTMGDIAVSLETNCLRRCFWNHFIIDGNEETPTTPRMMDAAPGLSIWRRKVLLERVTEERFGSAEPKVPA